MAQTEREFFETAIERSGALNSSNFARKLGISTGTLADWKKGRNHPSDIRMMKIIQLCDLEPVKTIALLNLWKCDESVQHIYAHLLNVAKSTT